MFRRFIEVSQQRYIQERVRTNTATRRSQSEPVLKPLREEGIKGIGSAWRAMEQVADQKLGGESPIIFRESLAVIMLAIGIPQFFLIASGIFRPMVGEYGYWQAPFGLGTEFDDDSKNSK